MRELSPDEGFKDCGWDDLWKGEFLDYSKKWGRLIGG